MRPAGVRMATCSGKSWSILLMAMQAMYSLERAVYAFITSLQQGNWVEHTIKQRKMGPSKCNANEDVPLLAAYIAPQTCEMLNLLAK